MATAGGGAAEVALACSVDAGYTLPLLVALASLRARLRPSLRVVLHLVHSGLPDDHLAAIARYAEVRQVSPDRARLAPVPRHRRFPREAAAPLLLGDLLPSDLDRVVFLDADSLVLDDPEELWTVDLGEGVLGAVVDGAIPRCDAPRGVAGWREREIPPSTPYFNAGVLTISLTAWRERDVTGRALAYLAGRRGARGFLHQEALNAVAWSEWHRLDPRWNVLGSLAGRQFGPPAPARPGIVHFAGRVKPWRSRAAGPFAARYRAALAEVASLLPPVEPTLRDRALGPYDRLLRGWVYPVERALWSRGVIR